MKRYELESLLKSFLIFFISLSAILTFAIFIYYKEELHFVRDDLKHRMWIYNFNFQDRDFLIDFVDENSSLELDKLYITKDGVFMYFPIAQNENYLKVIYPIEKYNKTISDIKIATLKIYLFFLFIILVLSFLFALYALYPLKRAINLLNEFLKDLIHDLNTPVSSIFINLKLLKKGNLNAIDRIEVSTNSISNLYKNLEYFIKDKALDIQEIDLSMLLKNRVEFFKTIYPHINFKIDMPKFKIKSNKEMIERVIDNLISNACKYNKEPNIVKISIKNGILKIEDSGVGIKHPNRIFDRYYKECDRGLGIGLHIVKKLVDILGVKISLKTEVNKGTIFYLDFNKVKI